MSKRAIPAVPKPGATNRVAFDSAIKDNLEIVMGQRGGRLRALAVLPDTATSADQIAKINECVGAINSLIERLQ